LVVNSSIVGGNIMVVQKESLLYYLVSALTLKPKPANSHLLKLVTGVETSTRPVNKSGRPGDVKRSSRTAAAAANNVAFLLSMLIFPV